MTVETKGGPSPAAEQVVASRVKIEYQGDTVDADELVFEVAAPSHAVVKVSDGAVIELRHIIKTVYRLCDKKKDDGSPIYLLIGNAVVSITPPGATKE